jgi:hypothetical protein
VIANIKLPMKQRVAMLDRVREILASGGWTGLKVRQLYHDRDEVTLFAWRGFGLDTRVQPRKRPAASSTGEAPAPARPGRPSSSARPAQKTSPRPSPGGGPPGRRKASPSGSPARRDAPSRGRPGQSPSRGGGRDRRRS